MDEKVSLVKEKINDFIVKLFSYLPYGGFYTDSEFDEITRELTITGKHIPRRLEGQSNTNNNNLYFIFGNFIERLRNRLKEDDSVVKELRPLIEVNSRSDGTTDVKVKCMVRK